VTLRSHLELTQENAEIITLEATEIAEKSRF